MATVAAALLTCLSPPTANMPECIPSITLTLEACDLFTGLHRACVLLDLLNVRLATRRITQVELDQVPALVAQIKKFVAQIESSYYYVRETPVCACPPFFGDVPTSA